jgi:hypothetical protein
MYEKTFDGIWRVLGCFALVLIAITVILTLLIRSCFVKDDIKIHNKNTELFDERGK